MNAQDVIRSMYETADMLVFGHRGAHTYAPMNTMPSYELAVQQGAHAIELDVHRSKDGHLVIVHDFTVDHTTNSTGLVVEKTLAELKALDAGSWFDEKFAGVQIPTLDEVFEAFGQKVFFNVEIKFEGDKTDGVEELVADCLKRHNMTERVILSSFNPPTLKRFRAIMPDVPIAFVYWTEEDPDDAHGQMANTPYEAYHPYYQEIDAAMVERENAAGRFINTWTVNDPMEVVRLRDMGVRGVFTDNPDTVLAALNAT